MNFIQGRMEDLFFVKNAKNVLYLMARDQRIFHNHCVNLGYLISEELQKQFYLACEFDRIKKNERQKAFIVQGLKKLEQDAKKYNMNFYMLKDNLSDFCHQKKIDCIILDFNPMREYLERAEELTRFGQKRRIRIIRVDTHNLVPCQNLEIYKKTAAAVRIQLNKQWSDYFHDMPDLVPHKYNKLENVSNEYPTIDESLFAYQGGFDTGMQMYEEFCSKRFSNYADLRNNTETDNVTSNLSPWITFGQISPQKLIYLFYYRFVNNVKEKKNFDSFMNEFFVWREVADHFVFHEKNYDNFQGALEWAKETLLKHKTDKRRIRFHVKELETGRSNDALWNAAQKEMVTEGKMHGYARMYWCKTLFRWIDNPEDALAFAIEQNDKYSIDGNCPNGFLGCMWSICGNMDRGFTEREISGKIRSMKPFQSPRYIAKFKNKVL